MGLDSRDYYRPSGGFSFFPPMIKNLLIINIAVYFIQMIFGSLSFGGVPGELILSHYFALNPLEGINSNFQIWQLLTYQFMHADFMHIFFNMLMMWMFGIEIENIMGSQKFLLFYILSGLGAGMLQLLGAPLLSDSLGYTIGASGAVYGIMIAFAMYFPDRYVMFSFLIPVKAKYLITFLIVIEFISVREPSFVAHLAHIGGALTAFIFILIDRRKQINVNRLFRNFKKPGSNPFRPRYQKKPANDYDVEDAKFYDINNKPSDEEVNQEEIDKILDKISQSGYQGLSDREKRILFEASKKK
ncbi:MAG: rhomboid family intramembrane serine protease [Ignavibacteriales bacterium]|nr:rhomboid family intramembrane serine protease [Ignavibacteriales bacterium]